MQRIVYTLSQFDRDKADMGALCVVVPSNYSSTTVANIDSTTGQWDSSFKGAGIPVHSNRKYLMSVILGTGDVDNPTTTVNYIFNEEGIGVGTNASGLILLLGDINTSLSGVGTANSSTEATTRVEVDGSVTTEVEYNESEKEVRITNLLAKDQFALEILRGLMTHIDNPAALSDNEMNFYCNVAYRWASNMMNVSADSRAKIEYADQHESDTTKKEEVGDLETNEEKLLNNIVAALEKTDTVDGSHLVPAHWYKAGEEDVPGDYTDATAQTLPHGDHAAYTDVDDAESDGWRWLGDYYEDDYSERFISPTLNAKLDTTNTKIDAIVTDSSYGLRGVNTKLTTTNTNIGNVNTTLGTTNTNLGTIGTNVSSVNTTLGTTNTNLGTIGSNLLAQVISSLPALTGNITIQIGDTGLGRDADNPIFTSPGRRDTNYTIGFAYGTSSTAAATRDKASTISGYTLTPGSLVAVRFSYGPSQTNPRLNITSTGVKSMSYKNSATIPLNTIRDGDTVLFMYDGTYYRIMAIDAVIDART